MAVYFAVVYVSWAGLLTVAIPNALVLLAQSLSTGGIVHPVSYGRFFTLDLIVRVYGTNAAMGLYFLVGGLLLVSHRVSSVNSTHRFAIGLVLSAATLFPVYLTTASGLGWGDQLTARIIQVPTLLFPIVAGVTLCWLGRHRFQRSAAHSAMVVALLLVPLVLQAPAVYPSPYVARFNYQNTDQLFSSVAWAASNLPSDATLLSNSHVGRYAYYPWHAQEDAYAKLYHYNDTIPPDIVAYSRKPIRNAYILVDSETLVVASAGLRGTWSSPTSTQASYMRKAPDFGLLYDSGEVSIYLIFDP